MRELEVRESVEFLNEKHFFVRHALEHGSVLGHRDEGRNVLGQKCFEHIVTAELRRTRLIIIFHYKNLCIFALHFCKCFESGN